MRNMVDPTLKTYNLYGEIYHSVSTQSLTALARPLFYQTNCHNVTCWLSLEMLLHNLIYCWAITWQIVIYWTSDWIFPSLTRVSRSTHWVPKTQYMTKNKSLPSDLIIIHCMFSTFTLTDQTSTPYTTRDWLSVLSVNKKDRKSV